MPGALTDAPTCVEFATAERIDPVGTAGHHRYVVVVELPHPWPRDIGEHPEVAPQAAALEAAGVRVQAVVPGPDSTSEARRLAHYWRPPGPFGGYGLTERMVTDQDLGDALAEAAKPGDLAGTDETFGETRPPPGRTPAAGSATASRAATHPTDVLVCGHGKRDQCCGTLGTRLVAGLGGLDAGGNGAARVRVWRTSHTGGHRFAPTALVLPEGTAWAFLDEDTLPGIVDRTLDVDAAAALYRGCTGLDDPAVQACDREALRAVGWSWLEHRRVGHVVEREGDRTVVRLEFTTPANEVGAFEATVAVARRLPVPECRRPISESRKESAELRVTAFRTV